MKKILTLILVTVSLFEFFACKNGLKKDSYNGAVIEGQLENAANTTLVVEELTSTGFRIADSTKTNDKGEFVIKSSIKEIGFYRFRSTPKNFCVLILDSTTAIKLTANGTNINKTFKVTGSEENDVLQKMNALTEANFKQTDSIISIIQNWKDQSSADSISKVLEPKYLSLQDDLSKMMMNFVDENINSFAVLAAIENLNPDKYPHYYYKVDSVLTKQYPFSDYVNNFHERIVEMRRLAIGAKAPEIVSTNPLGKEISLSGLKGKYVLLDFWASWCMPCRAESPTMVKLYKQYKDKDFEIFSVSLDDKAEEWKKAIMKDNLTWTHVSDLQEWQSKVVSLYEIKSIPQTYLIDKEGVIIAKGLIGLELEKKLKEVLDN